MNHSFRFTQNVKTHFLAFGMIRIRYRKEAWFEEEKDEPMGNLELLACALSYIEEHLEEEICTEDIADACYCSKSTVDKLFRSINRISVRDYIVRRRMTKAARRLMDKPEESVLDIALRFGYSTNESFTRAFKQVWNCQPSTFRKDAKCVELFPKMSLPLEEGDAYMKERRRFDISELYDLLKNRQDCYFICCDIKSLGPINEISTKAGDLAILEAMNRMEEAAGAEDLVFRIGGDEFVMLTNSSDRKYAEEVAGKIRGRNKETFAYEGEEIPLSLHAGITKCDAVPLKYDKLFVELHQSLRDAKSL